MFGKYCIIRTYSAGVHCGVVQQKDGKEVRLTDARRIWYWEGAFTLSAIAVNGLAPTSKLSVAVPSIVLTEAIEIIECTPEAASILREIEAYEAR